MRFVPGSGRGERIQRGAGPEQRMLLPALSGMTCAVILSSWNSILFPHHPERGTMASQAVPGQHQGKKAFPGPVSSATKDAPDTKRPPSREK